MATTTTPQQFAAACKADGFTFSAKPGMVTIRKSFAPGDLIAYVTADGDGPAIIAMVPTVSAGSVWGTDGATVGGTAGLSGGYYRLNVSGASKRFCTALAKLA